MDFTPIITAVLPVVIIGAICAAVLVIASKIMAVKEDERFPKVRECLPGANCGACGYAGCDGYAKALCDSAGTPTNLCIPGADAVSKQLSEVLGVEYADVAEQVAVVRCSGDCEHTQDKVQYEGIPTCAAAKLSYGGKGSCTYGCLGLGDCAAACPHDAVCLENGIARIDPRVCVGCGLCAKACPNRLITLKPAAAAVVVACSNKDKGALTRKACQSGCIGCRKCVKTCEQGAITVTDNCAVIDFDKCTGCGACAQACTTGCIKVMSYTNT